MIIQDIIDGLKTDTCPFCNKSMSCFAGDICSTCNRISYSKYHIKWKLNGINYLIELRYSVESGYQKINSVQIETPSNRIIPNMYVIFDCFVSKYHKYNYTYETDISKNTNLEELYKIENQIVKEEIFS